MNSVVETCIPWDDILKGELLSDASAVTTKHHIPSLGEARQRWPNATTCALLVDLYFTPNLRGYLSGRMAGRRRIDMIGERCHAVGASLIWVHPETKSRTSVDLFETTA